MTRHARRKSRFALPARTILPALAAAAFCMLLSGCMDNDIATSYGTRGGGGSQSVNGTTVFGAMFEEVGHRVETRRALTPYLQRVDTIVWFPNSFKEPQEKTRTWLERWLAEQEGRTLIYVARDYDAAQYYWETIISGAPESQKAALRERYREAKAEFLLEQRDGNLAPTSPWFTIERPRRERLVQNLEGPLSEDLDGGRAKIVLHSKLKPGVQASPLLSSGEDVLIIRQQFAVSSYDDFYYQDYSTPQNDDGIIVEEPQATPDADVMQEDGEATAELAKPDESTNDISTFDEPLDEGDKAAIRDAVESIEAAGGDPQDYQITVSTSTSQLITVVNGSFLLNLPLINHEHRKLAGKLIAETKPEGHTVFLESRFTDPPIMSDEPQADYGPGLKYLEVWPVGPVVLHLAILGIVFCFARWPIFGTPLLLPAASASDFGKHVRALGKLLSRTRDKDFAAGRIEHYTAKKREG